MASIASCQGVSEGSLRGRAPKKVRLLTGLLPALLVSLASFAPDGAAVGTIQEFRIPTPNSEPGGIALGWDNQINEYKVPTSDSQPLAIALDRDGSLWFTEFAADQIGHISKGGQMLGELKLPTKVPPAAGKPYDVTLGPDGNVWFTESFASRNYVGHGRIGRIVVRRTEGQRPTIVGIDEFEVRTAGSFPTNITSGPRGSKWLWFTESKASKIGRISLDGKAINEYMTPTPGSSPAGITPDPLSTQWVWFTESAANRIGRINTQ